MAKESDKYESRNKEAQGAAGGTRASEDAARKEEKIRKSSGCASLRHRLLQESRSKRDIAVAKGSFALADEGLRNKLVVSTNTLTNWVDQRRNRERFGNN